MTATFSPSHRSQREATQAYVRRTVGDVLPGGVDDRQRGQEQDDLEQPKLRDAKTSQTTTRIFNMLQDLAGLEFFMRPFPAVLCDNGPEFSDPKMIGFFRVDPRHNPHKPERRTHVFFCDPYRSSQKPHVERNHEEIRRVNPEFVTLDPSLLGPEFKREADNAILRRNGVTK